MQHSPSLTPPDPQLNVVMHARPHRIFPAALMLIACCGMLGCGPSGRGHGERQDTRYIGSSADWLKLRRDLEGVSENSFERARHLEARQLATNPPGVRRDGEALILKTHHETEVRLVDHNTDNSDATAFSYYDTVPALDAYVIHVQPYEGESWLLVSRKTGAKTQLSELPVVSPDKQRFATASEAGYDPAELIIWSVHQDGSFKRELQVEPGRWGPTFLQWLSPTRLRVRCDMWSQDGKEPAPKPVARIFGFADGKWCQIGNPEPWKE